MWRVAGKNVTGQGDWGGNERIHYEVPEISSLIDNGGFESGLTAWESCADSGTTDTTTDAAEGNSALLMTGSDCLFQEFAVVLGESYTLQCEAKGELTQYISMTLTIMDLSLIHI